MGRNDLREIQSDTTKYGQWQDQQLAGWESLCNGCGICCGVAEGGDPCEHLLELDNGTYVCDIYPTRFGLRKTRSGRSFHCVPIRDILHKSWPGGHLCSYKQQNS
jgi:uncharacterized cysteine cluster protein YcgN (CxxCxxCC family)